MTTARDTEPQTAALPNATESPTPLAFGSTDVLGSKPDPAKCEHPNKVERNFTYGYRMHCPDCNFSEESWWD